VVNFNDLSNNHDRVYVIDEDSVNLAALTHYDFEGLNDFVDVSEYHMGNEDVQDVKFYLHLKRIGVDGWQNQRDNYVAFVDERWLKVN
jgi:hypothetical protein